MTRRGPPTVSPGLLRRLRDPGTLISGSLSGAATRMRSRDGHGQTARCREWAALPQLQ